MTLSEALGLAQANDRWIGKTVQHSKKSYTVRRFVLDKQRPTDFEMNVLLVPVEGGTGVTMRLAKFIEEGRKR